MIGSLGSHSCCILQLSITTILKSSQVSTTASAIQYSSYGGHLSQTASQQSFLYSSETSGCFFCTSCIWKTSGGGAIVGSESCGVIVHVSCFGIPLIIFGSTLPQDINKNNNINILRRIAIY